MTTVEVADQGTQTGATRRRASRLSLVVHLEVEWKSLLGKTEIEPARTRDMSEHGALLLMKNYPRANTPVSLKSALAGQIVQARATEIRRSREGKLVGVIVELLEPNPAFWGLTFQLQRTTIQLMDIERAIQAQKPGMDFRVAGSLREVVEDLVQTASTVQQWQDLQAEGKDAYRALDALGVARLQRATRLLHDLTADIDGGELTRENEAFGGLARSVERFYDRLTRGPAAVWNAK
jgi:hypothetical protein